LGVLEELAFLIFLPFVQICGNLKAVFNVSAPKQNMGCKVFGPQAGADIRGEVEDEKEYYLGFRHIVERRNGGCGHDVSRRLIAEFCWWWVEIWRSYRFQDRQDNSSQ
jgi:hypothetical protein